MNKKLQCIYALFFVVIGMNTLSCSAQRNNSGPDLIIDNFFNIYEKKGISLAIDDIFSYGDSDVIKALPSIKDTISRTIDLVGGKYLGHDLIIKKDISNSLCFYSYIVKYPVDPLRFTFILYKPAEKWVIIKFAFDGNLTSELEEVGRLYFLK